MTRKRIRQMNAALLRRLSRRPAAEYLAGREDLVQQLVGEGYFQRFVPLMADRVSCAGALDLCREDLERLDGPEPREGWLPYCYGFARRYQPFLVNTVVGFIGPEYLYDARQVIRAGLEDHFMGKLTGIPMGCDACYTNHMKADQNDIEKLAVLLTAAGCNYFMGIPHGDDIMLNYQTTGFRETAALREITGKTAIPEFQRWLEKMGFVENGRLTKKAGDGSSLLF